MTALLLSLALAQSARVPVVIELFSSEGCSSCPPADRVLAALDQSQPLPGVEVLALEEHVDYWNYLGWRDPFSSAQFSGRQNDLDAAGGAQVYTPQLWVDGAAELNGAASAQVARSIAQAARAPKANIAVTVDGGGLIATVGRLPEGQPGTAYLALTERGLSTAVKRGENAGSTLSHGPVVRRFSRLGRVPAEGGTVKAELHLDTDWVAGRLRAVVFVQGEAGRIVAAGSAALGR